MAIERLSISEQTSIRKPLTVGESFIGNVTRSTATLHPEFYTPLKTALKRHGISVSSSRARIAIAQGGFHVRIVPDSDGIHKRYFINVQDEGGIASYLQEVYKREKPKKDPHKKATIENVTRGLASLRPQEYSSLWSVLRKNAIRMRPSQALAALEQAGIPVRTIAVEQKGIEPRKFNRYIVSNQDKTRIVTLFKSPASQLPSISPHS